jgi:hypothetical protein
VTRSHDLDSDRDCFEARLVADLVDLGEATDEEARGAAEAFRIWCRGVGLAPDLTSFAQWLADTLGEFELDELEQLRRDLSGTGGG